MTSVTASSRSSSMAARCRRSSSSRRPAVWASSATARSSATAGSIQRHASSRKSRRRPGRTSGSPRMAAVWTSCCARDRHDGLGEQLRLAREVQVDRARREAGLLGDVGDGRALVAALGEDVGGGVDDSLTGGAAGGVAAIGSVEASDGGRGYGGGTRVAASAVLCAAVVAAAPDARADVRPVADATVTTARRGRREGPRVRRRAGRPAAAVRLRRGRALRRGDGDRLRRQPHRPRRRSATNTPLSPAPYRTRIVVRRPADAADVQRHRRARVVQRHLRLRRRLGVGPPPSRAAAQRLRLRRRQRPGRRRRRPEGVRPGACTRRSSTPATRTRTTSSPRWPTPSARRPAWRRSASSRSNGCWRRARRSRRRPSTRSSRPSDPASSASSTATSSSSAARGAPDDLDVPVLRVLSEGEVDGVEPSAHPLYRQWEIAGGSHADAHHGAYWAQTHDRDWGTPPGTWPLTPRDTPTCRIGSFPRMYAGRAALAHLTRWVTDGTPAAAHRAASSVHDGAIARDALGNALGGVRLPAIEVPTATYTGDGFGCGPTLGMTVPFTDAAARRAVPDPRRLRRRRGGRRGSCRRVRRPPARRRGRDRRPRRILCSGS